MYGLAVVLQNKITHTFLGKSLKDIDNRQQAPSGCWHYGVFIFIFLFMLNCAVRYFIRAGASHRCLHRTPECCWPEKEHSFFLWKSLWAVKLGKLEATTLALQSLSQASQALRFSGLGDFQEDGTHRVPIGAFRYWLISSNTPAFVWGILSRWAVPTQSWFSICNG